MSRTRVPKVVMLLSNPYRPDPRVLKEAHSLAQANYDVTIICWDRRAELAPRESRDGVEIVRVQSVPSAYAAGWRQLFHLPRFWRQATRLALRLEPDLVHCHDLDTLFAGWQMKRRCGTALVYDAHEHYPALMSLYLPRPLVSALVLWERWLMRRVDATITASTVLRDEFLAAGIEPVITVGNYPDLGEFGQVNQDEAVAVRARLGVPPTELLVAYIGGFSRNRMLLPLIQAAGQLPHVHFHIWGDGPQRAEVEGGAATWPNVHYHGWLDHSELPLYFSAVDVIYYCLRSDYPGAIYNAPNTLSQAMAAGRPIIANQVGDLGRIVSQTACGVLLPTVTPAAICQAINMLQDPDARRRMGEAGRAAAEESYNWAVTKQKLTNVYASILGDDEATAISEAVDDKA